MAKASRQIAAEKNISSAQFDLSIMLDKGRGTEQNLVQAYGWASIAEQNGVDGAEELKADIAAKMSPTQIAAAETRAIEWITSH